MLITRIITGVVFGAAVTATLLFAPTLAAVAILGALWLAGAWEWASFARLSLAGHVAYTLTCAACMAVGWWWLDAQVATALLVGALCWWLLALVAVATFPRQLGLGLVAAAGFVVLLPPWLLLGWLHGRSPLGPELALTLLGVVWAADVGAFAFGRWFGRTKLAPAVSPGKTWEGVAGGVLAAGLVAGAAAAWLRLPLAGLVGLGAATAIASVVGDLTQSMFKRNVGLKDSGRLLPGHGGVLDRVDSLMAAIPVFVAGLVLLGLRP